MEQNFTPLPTNTNLQKIGLLICLFLLTIIGLGGWYLYSGNVAYQSQKDQINKDIDSKLSSVKKELKDDQQNSLNEKFEDLLEVVKALIDEKEEEYADSSIVTNLISSNSQNITTGNLIRNSSFESGENSQPRQWDYILDSTNSNTKQTQDTVRTGLFGLKFEGKVSGETGTQLGISQPVTKTIPGRTYSMSLYIKTVDVSEDSTLRFGFWDEYSNRYAFMEEVLLYPNLDWYRVTTTQKTSGIISDWANWYPIIEVRNHKTGAIYIDDVLLTEGDVVEYESSVAVNNFSETIGDGSVLVSNTGTMYPAQDGIGSLGTISHRWHDLYLLNATISENGDMNLAGDLTVGDSLTVNGNSTFNSPVVFQDSITFLGSSHFENGITVGENNEFTVNSEGNITKLYGVNYSFPSTQGGTNEILINDGSGNLSWGTFGSASVTPDSLDFSEFVDAMTLDSDTSINVYDGLGSNDFRIYNDDTSIEILFADGLSGYLGVGTTSPNYTVDINGGLNAVSWYISGSQVTASAAELNYLDGAAVSNGGVMFGNGTYLTQDETNFFWNDTSNRLGIGTTSPRFSLDVNGDIGVLNGNDLYLGSIGLNDTGTSRTTSGASKIGTFDEFSNSTSSTVQDVLDDLDAAITTFSAGAGDIEAVGSMTSGTTFADTDADDQWLGLGAGAGRIEFDNEVTNEVNVLDAFIGIGSTTPSALLSVGSLNQFTVDNNGNLSTSGSLAGSSIDTGQGAFEIQDASTSNKGLASFSNSNFSVTSGNVSLVTGGVGATELASSGVASGTYGSAITSGTGYFPILTVDTDGRVTSASTTPVSFNQNFESPLTFSNGLTRSSNTVQLGGTLTADVRLNIGNTEVIFTEFTNGNVGIGTVSPSSKLDVIGNAEVSGSVTAGSFSGSGASLTALNASQLTTGTVPSARISGSYTGITGTGALNAGSITSGFGNINIGTSIFTGNGSGLTSLNATQLTTGTLPDARLTGSYTGLTNLTGSGVATFGSFSGSGASLTALNASQLTTGTVPDARITGAYTGITNLTMTGDLIVSGGNVSLNNGTSNMIDWSTSGVAAPTFTSRSAGTKLVLYPNVAAASVDYALGIQSSSMWFSVPTSASVYRFYGGTTEIANLTGAGNLSVDGSVTAADFSCTNCLEAGNIATDAIGTAEIDDNVVSSTDILDSTILTGDIGLDTILAGDIAAGAIGASEIATDAVGTAEIDDNVVSSADILDSTILTGDIGVDTIVAADIAANVIGDSELFNGGAWNLTSNIAFAGGGISFSGLAATAVNVSNSSGTGISTFSTNGVGLAASSTFQQAAVFNSGSSTTTATFTGSSGTCTLVPGITDLNCTSDARLKKDIVNIDNSLEKVMGLRGVYYRWNQNQDLDPLQIGFIAQEVEKILPQVVYNNSETGYKQLSYAKFTPLLVNAIQEQQQIIDNNYRFLGIADVKFNSKIDLLTSDLSKITGKQVNILGIQKEVTSLEDDIYNQEQQIFSLQNQMNEVFDIINNEEVASEEANIVSLTERVSFLEKILGAEAVSASTTKEASDEASISTEVLEDLTVTGKTNLFDLGVVGDINASQIVIHGNEAQINSLGLPLEIQSESTNPVEIMGGKVTIETNGNLIVKESITAKKYNVDEAEKESASIGEGIIKAGDSEIVIETTSVTESSKIFLTPTKETDLQLAVVEKDRGKSFKVKIVKEAEEDISFNWWIVN